MVEPLRHRQTKEAETDMFDLQPPRHISTLHYRSYAENDAQRPLLEVKANIPCCGAVMRAFDPEPTCTARGLLLCKNDHRTPFRWAPIPDLMAYVAHSMPTLILRLGKGYATTRVSSRNSQRQ